MPSAPWLWTLVAICLARPNLAGPATRARSLATARCSSFRPARTASRPWLPSTAPTEKNPMAVWLRIAAAICLVRPGGGGTGDGTVFEVAAGSGSIVTLASFNGSNGSTPLGGLAEDSSHNLFGTTSEGGASGGGTVFELPFNRPLGHRLPRLQRQRRSGRRRAWPCRANGLLAGSWGTVDGADRNHRCRREFPVPVQAPGFIP